MSSSVAWYSLCCFTASSLVTDAGMLIGNRARSKSHLAGWAMIGTADFAMSERMKQLLALLAGGIELQHLAPQLSHIAQPCSQILRQQRIDFTPQSLCKCGAFACG